jgi:RNA polymerase sigma factor (TIGR02999 family)
MSNQPLSQTTSLVQAVAGGDRLAADQLMAEMYGELRTLARRYLDRERPGHTLQPTALVNEVYLKLVDQIEVDWKGRTHFFALGAQVMRRVLVDHARRRGRAKRGGGLQRATVDVSLISARSAADVLAVHEAIEDLGKLDPRQARIVELRFFGGLSVAEVAEVLGLAQRTVEAEWTMIRAWLRRRLSDEDTP